MATQLLTLSVLPKGKPFKNIPSEIALPKAAPSSEIYQQLAAQINTSTYRVRVTKGSDGTLVPNDKEVPVLQTGLLDGSKIYVKDLGLQADWRTVYIIEYFGPLIIHPLVFQLRPYLYSNPTSSASFPPPSFVQSLSLLLICLHFLKREVETVFIHRFSNATMPFFNIFKNSAYYWAVSGIFIAYFTYSPTAPSASGPEPLLVFPGLALYVVGELANLYTHLVLRSLRKPGTKERQIPRGFGFNWVTCPNYMFEIIAWLGLIMITKSWATAGFITIGAVQMTLWGKKKERAYRKDFGDKYKKKKFVLFPGIA